MSADFEVEPGVFFGEWLHQHMQGAMHFETEQWAIDRVRRIEDRLQAGRPEAARLLVEIPWMETPTAFTAPGRYIYFSRRLYERCPDDEQVASVVAHELAHHDLSHVDLFAGRASQIPKLPGAKFLAFGFHLLERTLYGLEKECDADRHALELCLAAGYDGRKCVTFFDIFEHQALDVGAWDAVFGEDAESSDEPADSANWLGTAQTWIAQHKRGYPSLRERKRMLLRKLQGNFS